MFHEYPKWIADESHEHGGYVVMDAEEEAAKKPIDPVPVEEKRKPGRPKKAD